MNSINMKKEMLAVVKSDEAKEVFEEGLKNLDPKALSSDGIIQSYEIDYEKISQNPMGGINVTLYANKDKKLYVFFTLNRDSSYVLTDEGGGNSSELEKLLEAR